MTVYFIKNNVNGRIYIGKTKQSLSLRWKQHIWLAKKRPDRNCLLHRAILKYGHEAFTVSVICHASSLKELNLLEKEWISKLKTYPPELGYGYNLTPGGDGKGAGSKWSESQRQKMSQIMRGRFVGNKNPMYGKKNPRAAKLFVGHRHTEDYKIRRSRLFIGSGNPFFGHVHSNEFKRDQKQRASGRSRDRAGRFIKEIL